MRRKPLAVPALLACGLAALAYGTVSALVDVPVRNWRVASLGAARPLGDISGAVPFIAVTPCRIVDTRGGGPWTGDYGPPALVASTGRTFDIPNGPCSGIPATAVAYSLNITVISGPSAPAGSFLTAWPTADPMPTVSTLNFGASQVVANAAVVPAGRAGSIDVFANWATHVLVDINGYFTGLPNPGVTFNFAGKMDGGAMLSVTNTSGLFSGTTGVAGTSIGWGVKGTTTSGGAYGAAGVKGVASAQDHTYGVLGEISNTFGYPGGNWGVVGAGFTGGVYGTAPISTTTSNAVGVEGEVYLPSGSGQSNFGVFGKATSFGYAYRGAGVAGQNSQATLGYPGGWGVVGGGTTGGVQGVLSASTSGSGVFGSLFDTGTSSYLQGGVLGYKNGATIYGVYSYGNTGATGVKSFVEPHPTDPRKVIRFVSLEGPEAGTYFRGTGRTSGGEAVIEVPESFRLVTADDGITVQLTPVGELATMAVISEDLNRIVVRASKDVAFHYQVNGVRRAFRDFQPIAEGNEFKPGAPGARMPQWLPEESRRRLVTNGTYNEDGTVNQRTATRVGWAREWEESAKAAEAQASSAPSAPPAPRTE